MDQTIIYLTKNKIKTKSLICFCFSVIGRKVNMAARLMVHYPNKVTCDNETFQTCRLPAAHFAILVTKQMKGLKNIGVIREFLEQSKEDTMIPKSIKHSDYPLLGKVNVYTN